MLMRIRRIPSPAPLRTTSDKIVVPEPCRSGGSTDLFWNLGLYVKREVHYDPLPTRPCALP